MIQIDDKLTDRERFFTNNNHVYVLDCVIECIKPRKPYTRVIKGINDAFIDNAIPFDLFKTNKGFRKTEFWDSVFIFNYMIAVKSINNRDCIKSDLNDIKDMLYDLIYDSSIIQLSYFDYSSD